jgi:putative mRNA 3-end processing factor
MPLLQFTTSSIYCPQADIHIDPWKPVDRAVITHAHSDHAKWGCKHYLAHTDSEPVLRMRLGEDISLQTVEYGEKIIINGITISLHPAGHILGSAQIRVEHNGEVWVASGDYKLQDDHFCEPFEPVKCNVFITESTFGLPIYKWQPQQLIMDDINEWWKINILNGKCSVLMGYALGKMQRLLTSLQPFQGEVYAHGAVFNLNEKLRSAGYPLPYIQPVLSTDKKIYKGALVLGPSSAVNSPWLKRFEPFSSGYCSGWMALRGARNRQALDRGFVLSDHADWNELNATVKETGAEKVYATHGYTDMFARWLTENKIDAAEIKTMYGNEEAAEEQNEII